MIRQRVSGESWRPQRGDAMPGPYIHISAVRHAAGLLAEGFGPRGSDRIDPAWAGLDVAELAQRIVDHPNFAALGAIGPDLFFFLPDFRDVGGVALSSVLVRILEFLEGVYEALDPYIEKFEKYLGPVSENAAEELSRLTGGLSESVGNITGELGDILITALEDFVTQQRDWWSFFSLGLNRGYDEQAYFWSDMLHYRQTGEFGQALWRKASQDEDEAAQAYALGYLSHVATDTVGHGLVNQVAGGPFRLHWQRHHLVENHADAYWYRFDDEEMAPRRAGGGYDQLTKSALYFDIAFGEDDTPVPRPPLPQGDTLRDNWVRRRLLDIDSELPESVSGLLRAAIEEVFYARGRVHPKILRDEDGRPTAWLIEEAYRLFLRYLKIATVDGFDHAVPPPPEVFPNLDFPTPSDPAGDEPPGDDDGDFWDDLLDFILAVIAAIAYVIEVAIYLATLPWAILADVVTYPLRLGLYYALELPLFHLLKAFRSVLVRTGYLLPMADEIDQSLIPGREPPPADLGTGPRRGRRRVRGAAGTAAGRAVGRAVPGPCLSLRARRQRVPPSMGLSEPTATEDRTLPHDRRAASHERRAAGAIPPQRPRPEHPRPAGNRGNPHRRRPGRLRPHPYAASRRRRQHDRLHDLAGHPRAWRGERRGPSRDADRLEPGR